MTRGGARAIPSADALTAAARATIVAPAPRITIPLPSARAVKKVAKWTLGIVFFICALPFIVLGLFEWGMFVADQFYVRHTPDHVALPFEVTFGTWFGAKALVIVWLWRRDRRHERRERTPQAEIAVGKHPAPLFKGFKARSAGELQAARKAAAERFTAIAMQYVPKGYRVDYRRSLTGRCSTARKIIQAPRPVTRKALYVFLHECAHAHLHEWASTKPTHLKEMEAEQWAHAKMREHGVPVPRSMTESGKQYVARKIQEERRRGGDSINAEAARYARDRSAERRNVAR